MIPANSRGRVWPGLPTAVEPWFAAPGREGIRDPEEAPGHLVRAYAAAKRWSWPNERIAFLCDVHADPAAFLLSLKAAGAVSLDSGPDFELTELGHSTRLIIGGDCLDKGPNNLELLRSVHRLRRLAPNMVLLAGNHDIRTLLGLTYAERKETHLAHLFVRMGKKAMGLFQEVYREYVEPTQQHFLDDEEAAALLFPTQDWERSFPAAVAGRISPLRVEREVARIREKVVELTAECAKVGMTIGMLHATLRKCQQLFLSPEGEFYWFFEAMALAFRAESLLFVHAGVDDVAAGILAEHGAEGLNRWFIDLKRRDLFELYNGSCGNVFRTKYRDSDMPLSDAGRQALDRSGVFAIVHGHRNIKHGARATLRAGILGFECDASVDRNTRVLEGLLGPGGAAVVFEPEGRICSTSTDYPFRRVLHLTQLGSAVLANRESECIDAPKGMDVEVPIMSEKATKIKFKNKMSRDDAIVYLNAIVGGLTDQRLVLQQGHEDLELLPAAELKVQVKASRKERKEKFSLELSWTNDAESLAIGE